MTTKDRLLIAGAGPKTGSTLLADMFAHATGVQINENLMAASSFEASIDAWDSLSDEEQTHSNHVIESACNAQRAAARAIMNHSQIAKSTVLTRIEGFKDCNPWTAVLLVTRDWQSMARSLHGFSLRSGVMRTPIGVHDSIRFCRRKYFSAQKFIHAADEVVEYADVVASSFDTQLRLKLFREWDIKFPYLHINLDLVADYHVMPSMRATRQGFSLLTTEELLGINAAIKDYEEFDKDFPRGMASNSAMDSVRTRGVRDLPSGV